MRISVDAHALGRRLTGNEVYVRNLLKGFETIDEGLEFIAYVSETDAPRWVPAGFATRRISRNPFYRLGFDLARQLRRDCPDLIHVQYTAPLGCPVPVVVSVHDISYVERPDFFSRARATQLRHTVKATVSRAAKIITGSDFSRGCLERAYPDLAGRIVVIPNAADPVFRPLNREQARDAVRRRFGVAQPFLLTVGDLQPRKNQVGLIHAFAALLRENPGLPHHLVLAGKETWGGDRVREAVRATGTGDRIHLTGFVSDQELLWLYNASDFFVFPSFYEGFGLPVLEAMACGRAVACAKATAVPEVADGAAIFFDPHSTGGIQHALRDLLLEPELRSRMERLGQQRAAQFSWEKSARATLEVYYEVAGRAPGEHSRGRLAAVSKP